MIIYKVCPECYNENFEPCSDDLVACVECGGIYNLNKLENMILEEKSSKLSSLKNNAILKCNPKIHVAQRKKIKIKEDIDE